MNRIYACIDLKSFYASVECTERNLNPMTTNLVVADISRTEKTICLAVSPSLKNYGIPGRARLYEVVQKVNKINKIRKEKIAYNQFSGSSFDNEELKRNKSLKLDYIVAPPRMSYYIRYSTKIYNIYLKYFSKDDIHVYSIDEIFCDITDYLKYYKKTPEQLITSIIIDIYNTTGITATAGIGTNLYLAKVAMDIVAKHVEPNEQGVRIAKLDEKEYRHLLWNHKPLTDFWRVGRGYLKKLHANHLYTMGDIARFSIDNEDTLYKLFGINAELLIDHAWGYESCTMEAIKNYKPMNNCISSGQVLHTPYDYNQTKLIVMEMTDLLTLELVRRKQVTNHVILTIGYDIENKNYSGIYEIDYYGRKIPKNAHGTKKFEYKTSSSKKIRDAVLEIYKNIIDPNLLVRRINVCFGSLDSEEKTKEEIHYEQLDLFSNPDKLAENHNKETIYQQEEKQLQAVMLSLKSKYGKNSILKAMNLLADSTAIQRNNQIGGHNSE